MRRVARIQGFVHAGYMPCKPSEAETQPQSRWALSASGGSQERYQRPPNTSKRNQSTTRKRG